MELGINGGLGLGVLIRVIPTVFEPALHHAAGKVVLPLDGPTPRLLSSLYEIP